MAMEKYRAAEYGPREIDLHAPAASGQPCGCDPGCKRSNGTVGHICEHHRAEGHVRLSELNPEFIGAGGPGIYTKTEHPCNQCFPSATDLAGAQTVDPDCDRCFGTGYIHMQAVVRRGIGITYDCPCGCGNAHYVPFKNPIDGGPCFEEARSNWQRAGETFDTLTLSPSIHSVKEKGGCGWHGYITDGNVVPC